MKFCKKEDLMQIFSRIQIQNLIKGKIKELNLIIKI